MSADLRRLYAPRPVRARADPTGVPVEVEGVAVEAVREEWLVEDRWWTPQQQLRRHYFELALADGRAVTVFRRAGRNGWFRQRA